MKSALLPTVIAGIGILSGMPALKAAEIERLNTPDALNLGTAWDGGVAPGNGDVALLKSFTGGNNSPTLGASATWGGIQLVNGPSNATLTIGGSGQVLSLGGSGMEMAWDSRSHLAISAGLATAADQTWLILAGREFRVQGGFQGSHVVTIGDTNGANTGTASFSMTASSFTGSFEVYSGTLYIAVAGGINKNAVTLHGGALDLRQGTQSVGGINGNAEATVHRGAAGSTILVVETATHGNLFNGSVNNLGLTKRGTGTQIFNGGATNIRNVLVEAGRLEINQTLTHTEGNFATTVKAGGTLASSSGTLQTSVTVESEGSLGFAISSSTSSSPLMTITGDLVLQSDSNLQLDLTGPITGGQTFTLVKVDGIFPTGRFATVNGIALDESQKFTLNHLSESYTFQLDYTGGAVNLHAIPEPGSTALVLLGGLGLLKFVRRSGTL